LIIWRQNRERVQTVNRLSWSLCSAKQLGKAFRVMVIDSSPRFEGKQMCLSLLNAGISFDYGLINAAYYLVEDATKVLLGAHSMMSNGSLFSRIGTSLVAAACRQLRIPVIVVCPTVKFSERVQLDALCFNELGDPDELLSAYGSERGLSATVRYFLLLQLVLRLTHSRFNAPRIGVRRQTCTSSICPTT